MHDYHAVEALIERLSSETPHGVAEVRIRAGLTFSPEALELAWEMLTTGTSLEGSRLVVEGRRDERECSACGRSWAVTRDDVAGHVVLCPSCGSPSPIEGGAAVEVVETSGPRT